MLRVTGLLAGLILLVLPDGKEVPALTVGLSAVEITPRIEAGGKPVYMAGFGHNRKATGVHDPLFARAVVLDDGKARVALVSVDVVGLFNSMSLRVRKKLPGYRHITISSTHNHEGPDTMGIWGASGLQSGLDPEYQTFVEQQIVKAIEEADRARVPVTAQVGSAHAPELIRDSRLPEVKHDELVTVLFRDPKTGKNAGLLVQWNMHPEVLDSRNTLITADHVGYTVEHLQKKYKCKVVYFTGTVGGLMTTLGLPVKDAKGVALRDGTFEKAARYGELLGHVAEKAIAAGKDANLTPITARSRTLYLPLDNPLYVLARQIGVLDREAFLWTGDPLRGELVKEFDPVKRHSVRTELSYLRLGELEIACIPGEIYPELVLGKVENPAVAGADFPDAPIEPAIYGQLKGPYRMILGLANDEIGYILPKRQWDVKKPFCYGKKNAQYGETNSLGSETGPLLCEAFRDLVADKK